MIESGRPSCYPAPAAGALSGPRHGSGLPFLDVLTSPVPAGRFDSPVDHRHVLCLHVGAPVPVSWRTSHGEQRGTRLHGQFCIVPAGSSTRWTLTKPAKSLLLRLAPDAMQDSADAIGLGAGVVEPAPAIHVRDPQVERIGWLMQAESRDGYPSGRLFADGLAAALAARLMALRRGKPPQAEPGLRRLPTWRLRRVVEYIEAHLDRDLSLAELAAVAEFSVSHFKSLFKNATGVPVHRFVMERRVERARQLLADGTLGTTAIALATGFAHPSHLARWMRRVSGAGPADVRAMADRRAGSDPG